jgi:hypothetical protein
MHHRRKIDKMLWVITLLHNVDTLEVYEEAIRHEEADLQQTANRQEPADVEEVGRHSPAHTPDQPASTRAATQTGAGPRTRQPHPTKTNDPAKQQR